MSKALTKDEFIIRATQIHGNKYDYSHVLFKNLREKVTIICPEHGEFVQEAFSHLKNHGCPMCSKNKRMTKEEFILKARQIHGWKYDYSKVEYKNNSTKVCIICPEHGEFWQDPTTHINNKAGCPKCSKNYRYTTEEFLALLPEWIKERYDFSKFEYKRTHDKSIVICPEHGEFKISPHNIRKGVGCPSCSESKLEREVRLYLKDNGISFVPEYKHNKDFHKQAIDFYLPKYKVGIECQGIQHFVPTDFAGLGDEWSNNEYKHIIELDISKQKLCKENDIKLLYFTTEENKKLITNEKNEHFLGYCVFTNINELKNVIDFDESL